MASAPLSAHGAAVTSETAHGVAPAPRSGAQRVFSLYLIAQATVGLVWWLSLHLSEQARSWFELLPAEPALLDSLLVADLVVIVGGSLLGAWAIETGARWAVPVVSFCAGGLVYVTLYLMLWVGFTGVGLLCFMIMVPPATISTWIAVSLWRTRSLGSRQ